MSKQDLQDLIKCIHKLWYSDWPETPLLALKLHRHMSELFNYAEINETLCENNPREIGSDEFEKLIKLISVNERDKLHDEQKNAQTIRTKRQPFTKKELG